MKFHTCVDDNFFENPDEIVKYANSLEYFKSKEPGNWPGGRSLNMWEINRDLFDFLTKKALNYYFDLNKQRITWTYTNIRFHKIEPGDWELHDKKHTRIHKDNAFLGGVIYLNKGENDEETGTSFFDDNLNRMYSVNNYYNNAVFFQGCRLNHGATGINNNKERLIINFFMDDIQYKYMD